MMTHELCLFVKLGLPIVIVVLADNSLSLIRVAQEREDILRVEWISLGRTLLLWQEHSGFGAREQ